MEAFIVLVWLAGKNVNIASDLFPELKTSPAGLPPDGQVLVDTHLPNSFRLMVSKFAPPSHATPRAIPTSVWA